MSDQSILSPPPAIVQAQRTQAYDACVRDPNLAHEMRRALVVARRCIQEPTRPMKLTALASIGAALARMEGWQA